MSVSALQVEILSGAGLALLVPVLELLDCELCGEADELWTCAEAVCNVPLRDLPCGPVAMVGSTRAGAQPSNLSSSCHQIILLGFVPR